MQGKPQKEQAIRIYLPIGSEDLDSTQLENLVWVKAGYVNFLSGKISGERAARQLRILEEWLPLKECLFSDLLVERGSWRNLIGNSEEVIYLGEITSVRQIDKIQFGNSRLFARRLRLE